MPDQHRIESELKSLLSRPQYASMFLHRNEFRKPGTEASTPERVAAQIAAHIAKSNSLLDPVEVEELHGPLQFYRAHDGGSRLYTPVDGAPSRISAGTLGAFWIERQVAESMWQATANHPVHERRNWFMEFMRAANFVLPEWNGMSEIAAMLVPSGATVVVIRGRGSWRAMRTPIGTARSAGHSIRSATDVIEHLGIMPIPGTPQYLVPLFNDMWVTQVPRNSLHWPLYG